MKSRIKELELLISKAQHDYHNGQATISDKVYDSYIEELRALDKKNSLLKKIGAEPSSEWPKHKHTVVLGSLNKCNTEDEFKKWAEKYVKNSDFFVSVKLDGLSVYLEYKDGNFDFASTRGSGEIGEKISSNVIKMLGVPEKLSKPLSIGVRAEIVMSKEIFKSHFEKQNYTNSRNGCSGCARRSSGEDCDKLNVVAYKIYNYKLKTEQDQFSLLKELGFDPAPHYSFKSVQECIDFKNEFQLTKRDSFVYELDGLVFSNNNIDIQNEFGYNNDGKNPKASIAYKFDNIGMETTILDVEWSTGNSGRVVGVAILKPVMVGGVEIRRATLHNVNFIIEHKLTIGAKVIVERAGDVIPYISELVSSGTSQIVIPTKCPTCSSKLEMQGENLQCPNIDECLSQKIGKIKNWISTLNILEWGETLLQRLVETSAVESIPDLYKLTVDNLSSIERMGKKSAQKCYNILHGAKEVPLELFLGGLSIPMCGSSTIKMIINSGHDTLDKILSMTQLQLENVNGIGPIKAESIFNGLVKNKDIINELLDLGLTIKTNKSRTLKLNGYSICITGATNIKRADLQKMIQDNGGDYKSSISKNCTHLIIADVNSQSSKAVAARELGLQLISEEDFLSLIK